VTVSILSVNVTVHHLNSQQKEPRLGRMGPNDHDSLRAVGFKRRG
jgi:hypothetical protein